MKAPRFSIVIAAYNAEATLSRALESLVAQTVEDWEAIIVDDGSKDGTLRVAREWTDVDRRIRSLSQANGGASAARNAGIDDAQGEWIVFLDSDDTIDRRYLALMSRAAYSNAAIGAVCCGYVRLGADGLRTALYRAPKLSPDPFLACAGGPPTAIHGFMVRRKIIQGVGCFDTSLSTNEDWDLWIRVARAGTCFAVVSKFLAHYWDSNSSSLTKAGRHMTRDALVVMRRLRTMDPRVPEPVARYANGAVLDDVMVQLLRSVIWNAGALIGKGLDGCELLRGIAPSPHLTDAASRMGAALLDGIAIGTRCPLNELVSIWGRVKEPVLVFLGALAVRMCEPALKDNLLRAVEIQLLSVSNFQRDVTLDFVRGVVLTPTIFFRGYAPHAAADLVVFKLLASFRLRALRQPLVLPGPVSGSELRALIRQRSVSKLADRLFDSERTRNVAARLWRAGAMFRRIIPLPRISQAVVPASWRPVVSAIAHKAALSGPLPERSPPAARSEVDGTASPPTSNKPAYRVPVLMYERPRGLEHHLQFLRQRGYRSISPAAWGERAKKAGVLRGRPIVLAFDASHDFSDTIWPLLRHYGFSAHVFVHAPELSHNARADAGGIHISRLAAQGVTFGSHAGSDTSLELLSSNELLRLAIRARLYLEAAVGCSVESVAVPIGKMDVRTEQILRVAGYLQIFVNAGGLAPVARPSLLTPCIAIDGSDTIERLDRELG